ncbi:MAG: tetratricopeptide repeat protein [Vicingaceae bacterium]
MTKAEFTSLVLNPAGLVDADLSGIEAVVEEFPYCQLAHLLLAGKLKSENSMLLEKQLNLTAAYAPSRKVLFNLLNDTNIVLEESPQPVESNEPAVDTVSSESPMADVKVKPANDELEELIKKEISHPYVLDVPDVEAPVKVPVEKTTEIIKDKKAFGDWIRFFEGENAREIEDKNALVERFIEKAPRITPVKQMDVPHENLARSSSDDLPDELITETLARIHLEQGNRMKAMEIYERLKLKYPEKSPYFAAQIEFIKNK